MFIHALAILIVVCCKCCRLLLRYDVDTFRNGTCICTFVKINLHDI